MTFVQGCATMMMRRYEPTRRQAVLAAVAILVGRGLAQPPSSISISFGAGAGAGAAEAGASSSLCIEPPLLPVPGAQAWDWVGIIGTGQSLSVGTGAPGPVSSLLCP